MAPRAIWSGSITFGLVNVPVKLYTATQQKDVRFHQFEKGTGKRVHNKRVTEGTDDEVAYDDIVKGYEVHKGEFVIVTPEELEGVAPGATSTIDIDDFVDLADIDPMYFERTYYVGPANDAAARTYRLLVDAMTDTGKAAIGRFVMRTKEYLTALRADGGVIVLETLFFADEIRDARDVVGPVKRANVGDRELRIARQLIDSMATDWDPTRYADTYRERVLDLVERKAKGEEIVASEPEQRAPVLDLMAALEQSLDAARQGKKPESRRATSGGKRGGKTDYGSWSRSKLEDEARKRDIPGRSKMNKDELVDALERAS